MQITHQATHPAYLVIALFADGEMSFNLLAGDTYADLAELLDQHCQRHTGMPTAIFLKSTAGARRPNSSVQAGH